MGTGSREGVEAVGTAWGMGTGGGGKRAQRGEVCVVGSTAWRSGHREWGKCTARGSMRGVG